MKRRLICQMQRKSLLIQNHAVYQTLLTKKTTMKTITSQIMDREMMIMMAKKRLNKIIHILRKVWAMFLLSRISLKVSPTATKTRTNTRKPMATTPNQNLWLKTSVWLDFSRIVTRIIICLSKERVTFLKLNRLWKQCNL
jgi:hypothetical protein